MRLFFSGLEMVVHLKRKAKSARKSETGLSVYKVKRKWRKI